MYVQVLSTYMLHMTGEIGRQGLAHWPIVYGLVLSYEGDRVALDENDALEGKGGKGLRTFAFDAESRSVNWKAMFCRRIDIRVNELGIYIYISATDDDKVSHLEGDEFKFYCSHDERKKEIEKK